MVSWLMSKGCPLKPHWNSPCMSSGTKDIVNDLRHLSCRPATRAFVFASTSQTMHCALSSQRHPTTFSSHAVSGFGFGPGLRASPSPLASASALPPPVSLGVCHHSCKCAWILGSPRFQPQVQDGVGAILDLAFVILASSVAADHVRLVSCNRNGSVSRSRSTEAARISTPCHPIHACRQKFLHSRTHTDRQIDR